MQILFEKQSTFCRIMIDLPSKIIYSTIVKYIYAFIYIIFVAEPRYPDKTPLLSDTVC